MNISTFLLQYGDTLQVAVFFVLLATMAVVERLSPRRPGSLDRTVRWPTNLFLTFVNSMALGVVPISFITVAIWTQSKGWGVLNILPLPATVAIVVTVLVRAFISFGTHYAMHMVPWLWRLHRVHHLDTELDVTTTVRFHPLEFFVQLAPGALMVVAFGLVPSVLMFYELLDVAVTLWSHSNVRLSPTLDRAIRCFIVTPDLHRIHHSAWKPETNSNFGAVFTVWDMVFRTFRGEPRDGHDDMRLGLDDVRSPQAHRPLWLLGSVTRENLDRRP